MAETTPVERALLTRIADEGPLPFGEVMDAALYDSVSGFYATLGHAGRQGDFLTSVEVGPLFGACVASALDQWWDELGRPDPFTVVDAGAGRGTLARSVLAARPECAGALVYVAVETSATQRAQHPAGVESRAALPEEPFVGVVLANELLDNLPFDIVGRDEERGWHEVRVGPGFTEVAVELEPERADDITRHLVGDDGAPTRVPVQVAAQEWLRSVLTLVERGRVVVIDYAREYPAPDSDWLRTYRGHGRGGHPFEALGTQDITADVDLGRLRAVREPDVEFRQAEWLRHHAIEALTEQGRAIWTERAHIGDLVALRARSRITEAEALLDPEGLGGFTVLEWWVGEPQ